MSQDNVSNAKTPTKQRNIKSLRASTSPTVKNVNKALMQYEWRYTPSTNIIMNYLVGVFAALLYLN